MKKRANPDCGCESPATTPRTHVPKTTMTIALAGNPNCGKTTLFNALTGSHQRTGNYAGVTVEVREGFFAHRGFEFRVLDLPGTYALNAWSQDEQVARSVLLDEKPDLVLNVLDASNLERNLLLTVQCMELGFPLVGVLNMMDQAEAQGLSIDSVELSELLGFPLVKAVSTKSEGLGKLLDTLADVAEGKISLENALVHAPDYGPELERVYALLRADISARDPSLLAANDRSFLLGLIARDQLCLAKLEKSPAANEIRAVLEAQTAWLEHHSGRSSDLYVSEQRFAYLRGALAQAVKRNRRLKSATLTERIDSVLLHRVLSLPIFLAILYGIFQITFTVGAIPAGWLDSGFSALGDGLSKLLPDGSLLQSLVVNGIVGGVGGVFSFVPLILMLFALLSILEDSGYMARTAFIMDRFLHIFGLHGQSFLPMMTGFGCSVPAVMATRTLKNWRDRVTTVLIIPFMSCGAKLPVHVLLAAAFFPGNPAAAVFGVYLLGIVIALVSALVIKRTVLRGPKAPFVMELPPYRLPTLRGIGWHVVDKLKMYVKKAGTFILLASIAIWVLTEIPSPLENAAREAGAPAIESSLSASLAKGIDPVLRPLGLDGKMGIALISGFAAKEVIVSTVAVLYAGGDESGSLEQNLVSHSGLKPASALALMVLVLLLTPCLATLATIRAEIGSGWMVFTVAFTLVVAWAVALGAYHVAGAFA